GAPLSRGLPDRKAPPRGLGRDLRCDPQPRRVYLRQCRESQVAGFRYGQYRCNGQGSAPTDSAYQLIARARNVASGGRGVADMPQIRVVTVPEPPRWVSWPS